MANTHVNVCATQTVGHDVNCKHALPADHRKKKSTELSQASVRIGALRTTKLTFSLVEFRCECV